MGVVDVYPGDIREGFPPKSSDGAIAPPLNSQGPETTQGEHHGRLPIQKFRLRHHGDGDIHLGHQINLQQTEDEEQGSTDPMPAPKQGALKSSSKGLQKAKRRWYIVSVDDGSGLGLQKAKSPW